MAYRFLKRCGHWLLLPVCLALLLGACALPAALPVAEEPGIAGPGDRGAASEFDRILACVEENLPAEGYATNEFLPEPGAAWEPMTCDSVDHVKVGMSWILNDGAALWYNAIELGYFSDVCLEVEMVKGGPDVDQVRRLAEGEVDFAVDAAGSGTPRTIAASGQNDLVAVGTFLQHSPYVWLGIDHDTPRDQRSDKQLQPHSFAGKRIAIYIGEQFLLEFLANRYGLETEEITLSAAAAVVDPLVAEEVDFTAAWIVNEPRALEAQGYMNWVAFHFGDHGWDTYADVSVVRRETLEGSPDLVRRYLAALGLGVEYLLKNPEDSAEIALAYGVDAELTREQTLRRFELQRPLIEETGDLPLGHMSVQRWNNQVAAMIQYGLIDVPACAPAE